jgi:hypothetical protein
VTYRGPVEHANGQQGDHGKRERRLSQCENYAKQLDRHSHAQQREGFHRAPDTLRGQGKHADEIVEVIKVLKQDFHGALPCNRE